MPRNNKSRTGVCCICGAVGKLSFEHVPPEFAFNDRTVTEYEWKNFLVAEKSKGRQRQRGAGAYTLCERCNSNTGHWYGAEYAKWAHMCQPILRGCVYMGVTRGAFSLRDVYPLRFLKQTVTMFFSLIGQYSSPVFAAKHPPLVEFVLNKESKRLPDGFRFWMNFFPPNPHGSTSLRRNPLSAKITIVQDKKGRLLGVQSGEAFEEITHPPFALYMTMDRAILSDAQEITSFQNYSYHETANVTLNLKILRLRFSLSGRLKTLFVVCCSACAILGEFSCRTVAPNTLYWRGFCKIY